jgi:hypothetical protein
MLAVYVCIFCYNILLRWSYIVFFDVLILVYLLACWALINLISGSTFLYIEQMMCVMVKTMELCKIT